MFVEIKRGSTFQQPLIAIIDRIRSRSRKDLVCGLAENFRARQSPVFFAGSIDQDEPPIAGILHENGNRYIFDKQVEEVPGSIALLLGGDSFRDVLVRGHPSAVCDRPGDGMRPSLVFSSALVIVLLARAASSVAQCWSMSSEKLPVSLRCRSSSRIVHPGFTTSDDSPYISR